MKKIMEEYSTTFFKCAQDWPKDILEDVYKLYAYLRVADEMVEGEDYEHDYKQWREVIEQFHEVSDKYEFDGRWLEDFHQSMFTDLVKNGLRFKDLDRTFEILTQENTMKYYEAFFFDLIELSTEENEDWLDMIELEFGV